METRKLKEEEYQAALQLALDVFMQFEAPIYPEEGIQDFTHFIKEVAPGMTIDYYGAFDQGVLVGMMAMREPRHLTLAFIRDDYQRMGIGRCLFICLLHDKGEAPITVNSSPIAVDFYHKLGFKDTDVEQTTNGVSYIPMCRKLEMEYKITIASQEDVSELLELQYKSFGPLVKELHWDDAPNMTETFEQANAEFWKYVTLKVEDSDGHIIASIRGNVCEGLLWISRLMVLPEYQRKGLGRRLLRAIQERLPHETAGLGTCLQVSRTMDFYESEGFRMYDTETVGHGLTWALMKKDK